MARPARLGSWGWGALTTWLFSFLYRYKAVWLIFFVLGLGTLLPWNFFITATQVRLEWGQALGSRDHVP